MSNKDNEFERSDYEQQWAPGESPSSDAIAAAYAAVAKHKEALAVPSAMFSRHSPEGFDEVLESAQREDVKLTASEFARKKAKHAADMLDAWARGETLEWREFAAGGWREYVGSLHMPNVVGTGLEWRIKRIPRKVWLAFHESGSVRDISALEPDVDPDGPAYIEFEEKLS